MVSFVQGYGSLSLDDLCLLFQDSLDVLSSAVKIFFILHRKIEGH